MAPSGLLEHLKIGSAHGATRLHGTLGEGRHAGIELRAVEHNGRVSIELRARDAGEAAMLRADLPEIRQALAARGLEQAEVIVTAPSSEMSMGHGHGNEHGREHHHGQGRDVHRDARNGVNGMNDAIARTEYASTLLDEQDEGTVI